jgi:hypothetical protein
MMPVLIDCYDRHDTARQYQRTLALSANSPFRALVRPGQNTAILERYLGPAPPTWVSTCMGPPHTQYFFGLSAYRYEELITCVPEGERAHVLRSISNPENCLLHHQIYLLRIFNYTDKPLPKDWWEKNRWAFDAEYDIDFAIDAMDLWSEYLAYYNQVPKHENRMLLSEEYARLIEVRNDLAKAAPRNYSDRRPRLPDLAWLR